MDFSDFSSKDAIILAIIVIAMYVLVSLLRLAQMRWRRRQALRTPQPRHTQEYPSSARPPHVAEEAEASEDFQKPQESAQARALPPVSAQTHRTTASAQPGEEDVPVSFSDHLSLVRMESAITQLQREVTDLRESLTELQSARHVSPQYAEAMAMARRGLDAQAIAERCTISMGEAELVAALSRNRQEYENYEEPFDERH